MPTESDLRDLLRGVDSPELGVPDARTVIARSKRRRLPRQLGMGGVVALSAVGITTVGIQSFGSLGQQPGITAENATTNDGSDSSGSDATGGAISRAPADKLNLCGSTLAAIEPGSSGLTLTTDFPDARAGDALVAGTVTLTNTSTERVIASSDAVPTITLSRDGLVVWHSVNAQLRPTIVIDLSPGESLEFASSLEPVVCSSDDELGVGVRADLPPAPAGSYEVSAALDVALDGTGMLELVTGPRDSIELR